MNKWGVIVLLTACLWSDVFSRTNTNTGGVKGGRKIPRPAIVETKHSNQEWWWEWWRQYIHEVSDPTAIPLIYPTDEYGNKIPCRPCDMRTTPRYDRTKPSVTPFIVTRVPGSTTTRRPGPPTPTTRRPGPPTTTTRRPGPPTTTTRRPGSTTTTKQPGPPTTTTKRPGPPIITTRRPKPPPISTTRPPWSPITTPQQLLITTTGRPWPSVSTTKRPWPPISTTKRPRPPISTTRRPKEEISTKSPKITTRVTSYPTPVTPSKIPTRVPTFRTYTPSVGSNKTPKINPTTPIPKITTRRGQPPITTTRRPQPFISTTTRRVQPPFTTTRRPRPFISTTTRRGQPPVTTTKRPQPFISTTTRRGQPPFTTTKRPQPFISITTRREQPPVTTTRRPRPFISTTTRRGQPPITTTRRPQPFISTTTRRTQHSTPKPPVPYIVPDDDCITEGSPVKVPRPDRPRPEMPSCALSGKHFCILTDDYPEDLVNRAVDKSVSKVRILYEELQAVADPELFRHLHGDGPASRGSFACETESDVMRPGWAQESVSGDWMVVVNTDLFPQKVRTESCKKPNEPCSFVSSYYESTCQQRYSLHRLLAVYPHDPNRSPVVALFKFPAGCSCRVDPVIKDNQHLVQIKFRR